MRSHQRLFRFLKFICPEHLYEELEGDLLEKYARDVLKYGESLAEMRLARNVLAFVRPGIIMRNRFSLNLNNTFMFQNYLKTTTRHIAKSKVNFVFKLGGLTLALFSFLVVALFVNYQFSFDRYHDDYDKIYRVNSERLEDGKPKRYGIVPSALGPMLKNEFPEVAAYSRIAIGNGSLMRYNQKLTYCGIFNADSTLFDVLTFKFVSGDRNALTKPNSVVITTTLARKVFGDEDPLHKIITFTHEPTSYEVTAVIEDMPSNSHFHLDGFKSYKERKDFSLSNIISPGDFIDEAAILYVRFKDGSDTGSFTSKVTALLDRHIRKEDREASGYKILLQPITEIYLDSAIEYDFAKKGTTLYIYIFSILGIFLLGVAIINYINLSVADFSGRSREIGVRKIMGARRLQIIFQVVLETLFFASSALGISVVLLYIIFPDIASIVESHLNFGMLLNGSVVATVLTAIGILVVLSAGFPAIYFSKTNTAEDLKGMQGPGYNSVFNRALLATQFSISIICMAATLVIGQQIQFIHDKDLGIDRKNLVVLTMPEDFNVQQLKSFKNELSTIPAISAVSNSSFKIGGGFWKDIYSIEIDGEIKELEVEEVFSDDQLFSTLGMKLLEGRAFRADTPADSTHAFVVNETAVREWHLKDPIGTRIFTHPEEKRKFDGSIVGVVADVNIRPLRDKIQPLVMRLPWQSGAPEYFVYARIQGDMQEAAKAIGNSFNKVFPGYPMEIDFVDQYYNEKFEAENRAYSSLQFGSLIIILISSLGIFSMSIYMSVRRMKEFGIRKVLGATVTQIASLHTTYFIRIVLVANVIAMPVSYFLMKEWLNGFAYRTELKGSLFFLVGMVSLLMVIISAFYSSWKAGRMNPVDVIKMRN